MAIPIKRTLDFENTARITNLPASAANGQPVVHEQLAAAIEGLSWKDNVRAASTANIALAAPGASVDGVAMVAGDRLLAKDQTLPAQNGIYVWNGAAVAATRALDVSTFAELESAVVVVDEGTANAGTQWRQTQVNGVIDTNAVVWAAAGTAAPASESTSGIAEIATQAETDAGVDDQRMVTPLKMATYSGKASRFSTTIGDGSATSIAVNHGRGTKDIVHSCRETGGSERDVGYELQRTSINVATFLFDVAPAVNSLRVTIVA